MTSPSRTSLTHQAVVFTDDDELVDVIASVAGQALRRGSPVLTVLPGDLTDRVRERTGADPAGLGALPFDSCYDAAPRTMARFVDTVRGYLADGHRPTLVGNSMLVDRDPSDVLPWLHMESVLNDALIDADAHLVCCFPHVGLDPWVSDAVWSTHPSVIVGAAVLPSAGYLPPTQFLAAHPEAAGSPLGRPVAAMAFDRATLRAARLLVTDHAARAGLDTARIEDLTGAVNEATSNTVEHGPGVGTLRIWAGPGAVTCEVHDSGRIAAPYLGLLPPPTSAPRGRGLWLIRQLSDTRLWNDDTGSTVRMTVCG